MIRLVDWKLSRNEKAIIKDALDGGSFYEEAEKTAFGWTSPKTAGLTREQFNSAIESLKRKGYVDSYSEWIDEYDRRQGRIWWLMSMQGEVEVDRESDNPFGEDNYDENQGRSRTVTSYESRSDKVKLGDVIQGYKVQQVVNERGTTVLGIKLKNGKWITFGFWTNKSTVAERISATE